MYNPNSNRETSLGTLFSVSPVPFRPKISYEGQMSKLFNELKVVLYIHLITR